MPSRDIVVPAPVFTHQTKIRFTKYAWPLAMYKILNPAFNASRAVKPSYTPGQTTISCSCANKVRSLEAVVGGGVRFAIVEKMYSQ